MQQSQMISSSIHSITCWGGVEIVSPLGVAERGKGVVYKQVL